MISLNGAKKLSRHSCQPLRMIIIGAGYGGLYLALGALKLGIEVVLLEKRSKQDLTAQDGYEIFLPPAGYRCLEAVLTPEQLAHFNQGSAQCSQKVVLWSHGYQREMLEYTFSSALSYTKKRPDHISSLIGFLPEGIIRYNEQVIDLKIQDSPDGTALVKTHSGLNEKADLVVDTSGIGSNLGKSPRLGLGLQEIVKTQYKVVLGQVPNHALSTELTGVMSEYWHPHLRILWFPSSQTSSHFAAVTYQVDANEMLSEVFDHKSWLKIYEDRFKNQLPSKFESILKQFKPVDWKGNNRQMTFVYPKRLPWGIGTSTRVGDSAHGAPPSLGTGALMALEDAYELLVQLNGYIHSGTAEPTLKDRRTLSSTLRTYERKRIFKTQFSWWLSVFYYPVSTLKNPILIKLRNLYLRWTPPFVIKPIFEWIFSIHKQYPKL